MEIKSTLKKIEKHRHQHKHIIVWLWKNIIRGRFKEVTPPANEYAYLHTHTRAMQNGHTAHI